MKKPKRVYVKNYTTEIDNVKSEPSEGYFPYTVLYLEPYLESFDSTEIELWHPKASVIDVNVNVGLIEFEIEGVKFHVSKSTDGKKIILETEYERKWLDCNSLYNNLNVFKEFKHSFIYTNLLRDLEGLECVINSKQFKVERFWYRYNHELSLAIKVRSENFNGILNYSSTFDGFKYEGISFDSVEIFYSSDELIDLDRRIAKTELMKEASKQIAVYLQTKFPILKFNDE